MSTPRRTSHWVTLAFLQGATYVFAKVQGGFTPWFLAYGMGVVTAIALLVGLFTLRGVSVSREIEQSRVFAGDTLKVSITVKHRSISPLLWLVIEDELEGRLEERAKQHRVLLFPGFSRHIHYSYEIPYLPRGAFRLKAVHVRTGDLFGFVHKAKEIECEESFIVYPRMLPVIGWSSLNERNMGNSYVLNRSIEDVSSVVGVREYVYGDRMHRIHWKSSARSQTLKTKEFETRVTNDFMFFLDATVPSYRSEYSPLFERAVQLTASLMKHASDRHFSMGLLCLGASFSRLRMSKSVDQLLLGTEALTHVKPNGRSQLHRVLLKEASYLPVGTTLIVVTPTLSDELINTIYHLAHRKIKLELFWMIDSGVSESMRPWTTQEKQRLEKLERIGCPYHTVLYPPYDFSRKGGTGHVTA